MKNSRRITNNRIVSIAELRILRSAVQEATLVIAQQNFGNILCSLVKAEEILARLGDQPKQKKSSSRHKKI